MKRRAFTLIELLVVIGIITVLAGLLVMGVGRLQSSNKRHLTTQILENCRAMYAEYDSVRRQSLGTGWMRAPRDVNGRDDRGDGQDGIDRYGTLSPQSSPATEFYDAVIFTRDVMLKLKAMPNNAAALGKMSPDMLMYVWNSPADPKDHAPPALAANQVYFVGDRASYGGSEWLCSVEHKATLADELDAVTLDPQFWLAEPARTPTLAVPTPPAIPVMLDAWHNPIIFVAGGHLGIRLPPDELPTYGYLLVENKTRNFVVSSPDSRPFFASAGPDGNFSFGDDNLYSFEK